MIPFDRSPNYSENERSTSKSKSTPCIICGRGIVEPWALAVHEHNGGNMLVQEGEPEALGLSEGGDLGWWPIGADCAKRHRALRAYVYEWHEGEPVPAFPDEHAREAAHLVRSREAASRGVTMASRQAHETLGRLIAPALDAPESPHAALEKRVAASFAAGEPFALDPPKGKPPGRRLSVLEAIQRGPSKPGQTLDEIIEEARREEMRGNVRAALKGKPTAKAGKHLEALVEELTQAAWILGGIRLSWPEKPTLKERDALEAARKRLADAMGAIATLGPAGSL